MAEATWEKSAAAAEQFRRRRRARGRLHFLLAGLLILVATAWLIISGTATGARYFITVDELVGDAAWLGKTVRVSGAVLGPSIQYDQDTLSIAFTMAAIPAQFDDLATALHDAVSDPAVRRIEVLVPDQAKPDLLQHEAQAILTGQLGADGVFTASELLLKCPSRFEEAGPDPAIAGHADL